MPSRQKFTKTRSGCGKLLLRRRAPLTRRTAASFALARINRDLRVLFGRSHSSEEVSNSWTIAQHRSPPLQAVTHVEFPITWHPKQELSGLRSYAHLLFSR